MALGDGVRRNIRTLGASERERFRDALLVLQRALSIPCGSGRDDVSPTSWLRHEGLHSTHAAWTGPQFVPRLREGCNRFEQMLRDVDPLLSLHYWDWNEEPDELYSSMFVCRQPNSPSPAAAVGQPGPPDDDAILAAPTFERMRQLVRARHDAAHATYSAWTNGRARRGACDPFAFLLHANADRLFAMWQAQPGCRSRLDPGLVYGEEQAALASVLLDGWTAERLRRPWAAEDGRLARTCAHASVVAPPCYDTLPRTVRVDGTSNPGRTIAFDDVPTGQTFARAACFQVIGAGHVTFRVTEGPASPYSVITPGGALTVGHTPALYQEARLWFGFTGGPPRTIAPAGSVTIRCDATDQQFVFELRGNSVAPSAPGFAAATRRPAGRTEGTRQSEEAGVIWTWTWKPA